MDILMPSLFNLHCVLGPSKVLPNIGLLDLLAEHGKIDIWSMVPSLADELGETPDVLQKFGSSKFICASGGKHVTLNGFNIRLKLLHRSRQPTHCFQGQ
jgi:hypothetical protein